MSLNVPSGDRRIPLPSAPQISRHAGHIEQLCSRVMKIGSTTGYLPEMMEINRKDAERQGYKPDSTVCAGDVPNGRPYP